MELFSSSFCSDFTHECFDEWLKGLLTASPINALIIGIGLTVCGSCLMALGSVVMKIGIHEQSKLVGDETRVPLTSHFWLLGNPLVFVPLSLDSEFTVTFQGFSFTLLGPYCIYLDSDLVRALIVLKIHMSKMFRVAAPASVLAPLNSLGLVTNAAAAVVSSHMCSMWYYVYGYYLLRYTLHVLLIITCYCVSCYKRVYLYTTQTTPLYIYIYIILCNLNRVRRLCLPLRGLCIRYLRYS